MFLGPLGVIILEYEPEIKFEGKLEGIFLWYLCLKVAQGFNSFCSVCLFQFTMNKKERDKKRLVDTVHKQLRSLIQQNASSSSNSAN